MNFRAGKRLSERTEASSLPLLPLSLSVKQMHSHKEEAKGDLISPYAEEEIRRNLAGKVFFF